MVHHRVIWIIKCLFLLISIETSATQDRRSVNAYLVYIGMKRKFIDFLPMLTLQESLNDSEDTMIQ